MELNAGCMRQNQQEHTNEVTTNCVTNFEKKLISQAVTPADVEFKLKLETEGEGTLGKGAGVEEVLWAKGTV